MLGVFVEANGYRSRRYELMWPSPPTGVGKHIEICCTDNHSENLGKKSDYFRRTNDLTIFTDNHSENLGKKSDLF